MDKNHSNIWAIRVCILTKLIHVKIIVIDLLHVAQVIKTFSNVWRLLLWGMKTFFLVSFEVDGLECLFDS
jgi:hypothetical protein